MFGLRNWEIEVLNGDAYQVGKEIQATNAGKYVIKEVNKEVLFMGMQRKYEFVLG